MIRKAKELRLLRQAEKLFQAICAKGFRSLDFAGEDSGLQIPGIQGFAWRCPDPAGAAYAALPPLKVERATSRALRLFFDEDDFRFRLAVDFGDGEKLPFPVVREILLKVVFFARYY
jgi:hypothetical protein